MNFEDWIERRTFHHSAFWDIKHLVQKKEEQNLKISLCLPTLNEEKTIGKEIVIFKSELQDRYPLLDEIESRCRYSLSVSFYYNVLFGLNVFVQILPTPISRPECPLPGKLRI